MEGLVGRFDTHASGVTRDASHVPRCPPPNSISYSPTGINKASDVVDAEDETKLTSMAVLLRRKYEWTEGFEALKAPSPESLKAAELAANPPAVNLPKEAGGAAADETGPGGKKKGKKKGAAEGAGGGGGGMKDKIKGVFGFGKKKEA